MTESLGAQKVPAPSRRPYVYRGVALGLLLVLGLFCWLVVVPLMETGRASKDFGPGDEEQEVPVFPRQDVPSSERSRQAVARAAPALVADLRGMKLSYGAPVFMRVFKEEMQLEVWVKGAEKFELFRTYRVAACSGRLGPKLREGDRQAPEGFYYVTPGRMNPNSRYHLSFNLGYPNEYDRGHGRTGSALMVHGNRVSIGCFAMTDEKIEEIYALADAALRNGQRFFRVHCFPFRMTAANMALHRAEEWSAFWENLKRGYDRFEQSGRPPDVRVKDKRYVFAGDR